ncbi:MAG: ROK family protein [Actinomycetaceae bacterium]|nr:ROK family protein [Actinomycetaceae bacterium]
MTGFSADADGDDVPRVSAGIEVGTTSIDWMLVSPLGAILDKGSQETDQQNPRHQIKQLAHDLLQRNPGIDGFGVVVPGIVDEKRGVAIYAANIEMRNAHIAADIKNLTGIPTLLGHDGRAAGLAEKYMGAGKGANSFLMIPIGVGISMAACVDGNLLSGDTFSAGEIGHSPIYPTGDLCRCGQYGCLEVYASTDGMARRYSFLKGHELGAHEIQDRLGVDNIADEVWNTAVRALALGLVHLIMALDPSRIIVGGELASAGPLLLDPLHENLASLLQWRDPPEIVRAHLGSSATGWGTAILASMAASHTSHERWQA